MLVLRKVAVTGTWFGVGGGFATWNQRNNFIRPINYFPTNYTLTTGLVVFNLEGFGDGGGCVEAGRASVQIVWTATGFSGLVIFSVLPALELVADLRNMPESRPLIFDLLPRRSPARLRSESDPCC